MKIGKRRNVFMLSWIAKAFGKPVDWMPAERSSKFCLSNWSLRQIWVFQTSNVYLYQGLWRWKRVKKKKKKVKSVVSGRKGSFYFRNTSYTGLCNIAGAAYRLGREGGDQCQSCLTLRAEETVEPLQRLIPSKKCQAVK